MAMVAMNKVSAGRFSGVSFHSRTCPQGLASVLCKKTLIFGSGRSKVDHLTVFQLFLFGPRQEEFQPPSNMNNDFGREENFSRWSTRLLAFWTKTQQ
jgi:hypothetical protein